MVMNEKARPTTATIARLGWADAVVADERLLAVFLERLRRMLVQRAEHAPELSPGGLRLLDRAIFSTYCDCRTLGGQAIATGLLETASRSAEATNLVEAGTAV